MTRQVYCGTVPIGGGAPCTIQSMTNTDTRDAAATIAQIRRLEEAGCEIIRVAVPDREAAAALPQIRRAIHIPLVADIHFDYRLALAAIEAGVDKVRINPGNIGSRERVAAVVRAAKERHIPIRVGVNGGSLEADIREREGGVTAAGLVESALRQVRLLEELDFADIVISLKSSDVVLNTEAYRLIAARTEYPLHIGVTEAGTPGSGMIKSAVGLGTLLLEGIGDTMRVSLTGDPLEEVLTARRILAAAGRRREEIEIISCPTCGRTRVDLLRILDEVERALAGVHPPRHLRLAVMGCEVNGPGEAAAADLGVACGPGRGLLLRRGEPLHTVPEEEIAPALVQMVREWRE
ncbi:MAG: flavodoxin-dependent (E)-4-hydroxy-3-methylbut-2-enyl-diphosphate synthase [Anaerovoracaceae bacterium]|jgi:(E)-4-hydroxy-3-methylbut-2-enyl-diphosphate synthase